MTVRHLWQAVKNGTWAPLVATLVTAAVSFGFLTAEQASTANDTVAAVATAVSAVVTLVHALRGAKQVRDAEEK